MIAWLNGSTHNRDIYREVEVGKCLLYMSRSTRSAIIIRGIFPGRIWHISRFDLR